MEEFVSRWGYWAVFLGSLIEGESVILPAGYFASQGMLSLQKIILISFVGTLIADQSLFIIGHLWGKKLLRFAPRLQPTTERVFRFLKEYGSFYILTFRFIYGIRIISPLIIGSSGFPFATFAFLNLIAAILWAVISCGTGYLCGEFLMHYLSPLQRFLVLGSFGLGCLLWIVWKAYGFYKKELSS